MLSTVVSDTLKPSVEAAATSSPVADKCEILSEITEVESSILLMLCSAESILFIRLSTVFPTSSKVTLVLSISSFCLLTDSTDAFMLSLAFLVSS